MINRAADSALVPVAAAGHPDRRSKVDHQTDQQPRRARGIRQGSAQAVGEHGDGGQMERRQQHGNADAPGVCTGRMDDRGTGTAGIRILLCDSEEESETVSGARISARPENNKRCNYV